MSNQVNQLIDLPIYYINLDRSTDRYEIFNEQIKKYEIPYDQVKRITAIDGKTLNSISDFPFKIYTRIKNKPGVIACTLSHINAIKDAYNDNHPYVVIMEDDCNFEYVIYQQYKLSDIALTFGTEYNIIQLSTTNYSRYNNFLKSSSIYVIPGYRASCVAYIISRQGMKNVIDAINNKNLQLMEADNTIFQLAENSCHLSKPYFLYFNSKIVNSTLDHENINILLEDQNYYFWNKFYCDKNNIKMQLNLNLLKYKLLYYYINLPDFTLYTFSDIKKYFLNKDLINNFYYDFIK
jgi:GR25 family glycosyltransferase involved in LPS biosynthesis